MMLCKRSLGFINDIFCEKYNLNELASKYNISERMLRYDVNEINDMFMKYFNIPFIEIKNSNIIVLITKEMCDSLILQLPLEIYTLSSFEREYLIILDILLFTNKFKLQEISEAYLISKGTVRQILKNIHLQFLKYKISLKVSSSIDKGYKLIAKELDIRKFLINHIRKGGIQNENNPFIKRLIQSKLDKFSLIFDINKSKNEILKLLNQNELNINDEAFEIISYYLYISKNRNYGGFYINDDSIDNRLFLTNTKEYKYIKTNINAENLYENDILVITDFFMGLYNFNKNYSFFANWVHVEELVFNILEKLSNEFSVDFTKDRILVNEFLHHIKPAIYRMRNKLKLSESIVEQVIKLYPNIYFTVKKVMEHLKEILTIELDDDEISFITIMIKRALKRNSYTKIYKNPKVLIVCGFGYSSSKLISENLIENFYVDIVDTIPYNKLQCYENIKDIDLIITTLDLELHTHDIIKVNAIFTEKDIDNLIEYGLVKRNIKISEKDLLDFIDKNRNCSTKELKLKIRKKFKNYILEEPEEQNYKKIYEFLNEDNTKFKVDVKNLDEALQVIDELMQSNGYTNEKYIKSLKIQIKKYGSYIQIGENTILPHGELNVDVLKTGFVLITLKQPIIFFESKINIIIALASKNVEEHRIAILDINQCMKDKKFEYKLQEVNNYLELNELLRSIIESEKK